MRQSVGSILTIALLAALATGAHGAAPDPWARMRFLMGEWMGAAGGRPGTGSGTSTFALELDGKILVRYGHTDFPATATAAIAHRDLLVVYPGTCDSLFHAIYFDNEGHVIQYRVLAPAPGGRAIFDSEGPASGPRFRLTYDSTADGGLEVGFATAPPGGELTRHVGGVLRRVEPGAQR